MSYDVSVGKRSFNYTSNCSEIWYNHFPNGDGIRGLHGMTGKVARDEFEGFWSNIEIERQSMYQGGVSGEPAFCAKYDCPTGWGSTVGALLFVSQIQSACMIHPKKQIHVCC